MKNYSVGDIFKFDEEYSDRADFCNKNGLIIVEVTPNARGERQFQIQEIPQPTVQEITEQNINELKQKLYDTDYQAIKYAEGELTEREYSSMRKQRKLWREEIRRLEKTLNQ